MIDHPAAVRRHGRNRLQVPFTGQRGVEVTLEARCSAEVRQEVRDAGSAMGEVRVIPRHLGRNEPHPSVADDLRAFDEPLTGESREQVCVNRLLLRKGKQGEADASAAGAMPVSRVMW